MRFKSYIRKLVKHSRMNLTSPITLYGMSFHSDTFRRLVRYVNSHHFNFCVNFLTREFEDRPDFSLFIGDYYDNN